MRVAIAVEGDLDPPQALRHQPLDDVGRQQQSVGDDARHHPHAAGAGCRPQAIGQVVHYRQIQQRLATEEGDDKPLGADPIDLAFDPGRDARRGLERHLLGELVVIAVVALKAVIACEVALKRGEDRDMQFGCIALDARHVGIERASIGVAI